MGALIEAVRLEGEIDMRMPTFDNILAGTPGLPTDFSRSFKACFMEHVMRSDAVRQCTMDSLMLSANSFAVLALPPDGFSGQGYILPFGGRATPVVGYKGYNTMAARSGFTINGEAIRRADEIDYQLGTGGYIRHKPNILKPDEPIIGFWAEATHIHQPGIPKIMSLSEIMAIKNKSPGGRKKDSPWNDPKIGFVAMGEKSVKRRIARNMPLNTFVMANAMETQHDLGHAAYLHQDRGVIRDDGAPVKIAQETDDLDTTKPVFVISKGSGDVSFNEIDEWKGKMLMAIENISKEASLTHFKNVNETNMRDVIDAGENDAVEVVVEAFKRRFGELMARE